MTSTMTARQRMQAARVSLIYDSPFFGAIALRLRLVESPGCGTAYTDGVVIGYDPAFIESLTHDEVVFVVAHETMHCACGHMWRRDGREPRKANVAMDLAINPILQDAGFRMPRNCLLDPQFCGKAFEWIYARLPDPSTDGQGGRPGKAGGSQASGQGQGKGQGRPSTGNAQGGAQGEPGQRPGTGGQDVRDAPTGAEAGQEPVTEADWQQAVQQAAAAAKARGNLPASLDRFAKAAAQPRVDWESATLRWVQERSREDYSWVRPSTRHLARGLYLPSLYSEGMGPIGLVNDTSGSVDNITLGRWQQCANHIVEQLRPRRVYVAYADAKVHRLDTFERDEPIVFSPIGGGGTDFRPALAAMAALDEPPCGVIYLTDLMGTFPETAPDFPVLWAATSNIQPPFGEVISLESV